ncbi:hypothetical protein SRABI106_04181 [Rahnella aquatilis]|nr:hypothetical protein SRABI106_04181 [Rahnella aquatilis]
MCAGVDTHFIEVFHRTFTRFGFAQPQHLHRRFHDVFQHRHVAPQVEMLEHHRQFGTQQLQLLLIKHFQLTVGVAHHADILIINADRAFAWFLEEVNAAQEGTFSGT